MSLLNSPAAHWALAFALGAILPFVDRSRIERLKRFTSTPARLSTYRRTVALLWCAAIFVLITNVPRILFAAPGMPRWMQNSAAVHGVLAGVLVGMLAGNIGLSVAAGFSSSIRRSFLRQAGKLMFMLPVSSVERGWWIVVSLSAGICEELLYRGFLLHFLAGHISGGPILPLTWAIFGSSLLFGLAHVYQGWAGVLQTTFLGVVFALLVVSSGSLLVAMALHFFVDVALLFAYQIRREAPAAAESLIAGCDPSVVRERAFGNAQEITPAVG